MREILFRGKTKQGEWVYGLLGCNYFRPNEKYYYIHNCETDDTEYEVIPETVGQFTGLTDKNGKKIFEGDIIKNTFEEGNFELLEVIYNTEFCRFELKESKTGEQLELVDCEESEVIGNIHDNPELLETGE